MTSVDERLKCGVDGERTRSGYTAGRQLALAAGLIVFAALTGCVHPTKRPTRNVGRLASEFVRCLNTRAAVGDFDPFLEKWSEELEHTVSLATMRDKEQLREFLEDWAEMFTAWRHVEKRRVVQGNLVAWEGIARGKHRSTGRELNLPLVMIMEFDASGKVKMSHVYFDSAVLEQQLVTMR